MNDEDAATPPDHDDATTTAGTDDQRASGTDDQQASGTDDQQASGTDDVPDDDASATGASEPEAADRGGAGPRTEDGRPHTQALAPATPGVSPPRPPRRTGVFLDPEDLREHVGGLLRAILGGYEVDAFGNFTFTHEGTRAFVTVGPSPIGPQIGVFSVTNLDVDLSPQLASFLLTTNHKLGFGAFSYDPDNRAVWLRHTLLGSTLDLPELQSAVAAVATTAAALDETIRDRFGGRTFQEAPDDVQRRVEPPDPVGDARPPNASGYL